MGKPTLPNPSPGVYRDDPDCDDAAPAPSVVLLNDIDYLDSDLPAYEDVLALIETYTVTSPRASIVRGAPVPVGVLALHCATTGYSSTARTPKFLTGMLKDPAKYPPTFTTPIMGAHSEVLKEG
ncbi:MAG: hypothetical protein ALECFALPRED_002722 [Alectoria fallacina]|uniref:Uncharacterized protein n=1 Tax=Alectoria fallacina TaxID=1903189 RepID=A0A8H3FLX4_9LECA|nr:MAG: hypothetical protein ALECFALPRED_002722 [Alectoria fallacina]